MLAGFSSQIDTLGFEHVTYDMEVRHSTHRAGLADVRSGPLDRKVDLKSSSRCKTWSCQSIYRLPHENSYPLLVKARRL